MNDQFKHYYKRYLKCAEHGDAEAQYRLGELFYNGENISNIKKDVWIQYKMFGHGAISPTYFKEAVEWEKGFHEAVKWYKKAADQGHVGSQYRLGCVYNILSGLGDPYVYDESRERYKEAAEEWYQEAADRGYADAQHALGVLYEFTHKSESEATTWYRQAAEQGHAMAQYCLGRINGDAYWVQKAAEQGINEAQCLLGIMYHFGEGGVPKDSQAAVKWLEFAVRNRYAEAQRYLDQWYPKKSWLNKLFS